MLDLTEQQQIKVVRISNGWLILAHGQESTAVEVFEEQEDPNEAFAEVLSAILESMGPLAPLRLAAPKTRIEISIVEDE
jgi:hypothetical protein